MALISVVILNYRSVQDTVECLDSIFALSGPDIQTIVVDNHSGDGSIDVLVRYLANVKSRNRSIGRYSGEPKGPGQYEDILLVEADDNGGYGKGNNLGIRYAIAGGSEYCFILNNDTVVDPDCVLSMLSILEQGAEVGIVAPKIYRFDAPNVLWSNGGSFTFWSAALVHSNYGQVDLGQTNSREVTFLTGCAWFVRTAIFKEVGLINESYFMYMEDLEFCHRVRLAGYELVIAEEAKIWHKIAASSGGEYTAFSIFYRARNYLRFAMTYPAFIGVRLLSGCVFLLRYVLRLARAGEPRLIFYLFKGAVAGLKKRGNEQPFALDHKMQ